MRNALRVLTGILLIIFLATFMTACGKDSSYFQPPTGDSGEDAGGSTAEDTTVPTVPTGVATETLSEDQIRLSWSSSSDNIGVVGYKVYRDSIYVATAIGTSYSDAGLEPDTEYCYAVAAFDAAGNVGAASNEACAITDPTVNIWTLGADYNAQHVTTAVDGLYVSGRYNGWTRPFAAKVVEGEAVWTALLPGTEGSDNATGVAYYDGRVYVSYFTDYFGSDTGYEEYIAVLDGETGKVLKTISVPTCSSTGYGPGLAVDGNGIYSAGLYCLQNIDFNGTIQWKKTPGVISSVELDANGDVYVGGYADGPAGAYDLTANKYSPAGDQIWTAQWGTANLDMGGALCLSDSGEIYIAGAGVDENLKSLPVVAIKINAETGEVTGKTDFLATSSGNGGVDCGTGSPVVAMSGRLMSSTPATEWNVPALSSFTNDTLAIMDGVVYVAYYDTIRRYDVVTGEEITD